MFYYLHELQIYRIAFTQAGERLNYNLRDNLHKFVEGLQNHEVL